MTVEDLGFAMEELLDAYGSSGDPALLKEPGAQQLTDRLYYAVDWLAPCLDAVEMARRINFAMLLAPFYWHRYEHDGSREDATRAVFLYRQVCQVASHCLPEGLPQILAEQGDRVDTLSSSDLAAYAAEAVNRLKEAEATSDPQLLDDAVALSLFAARANPRQDVTRAEALTTLGNVLTRRYEYTGNAADLDRAYVVTVRAAEVTAADDPHFLKCCSGFGHVAIRMYQRTGDLGTLDLAINALRQAAYRAPDDNPHRAAYLTNLSSALNSQYRHIGLDEARNEALEACYEAVRITPRGHPDLPSRLINLASAVINHPDAAEGDDRAVDLLRDALSLTPDGHPDRPDCLHLLAGVLRARFGRKGDAKDLTEAVEAGRSSVGAGATVYYLRPNRLAGFARSLQAYADHFSAPEALTEAVEALGEAMALLPEDHPDRTGTLITLGFVLWKRFRTGKDPADRAQALHAMREAASVETAPARDRARAAAVAGHLAAGAQDFADATESFALALDQLELTAWRGLERDDQERLLAAFPNLVTDAAACAVRAGQPERAVELLEQGRGILLAQALETRADHHELQSRAPELAEQLGQVLGELDRLAHAPSSGDPVEVRERRRANERRAHLARQRDALLADIRALPKLSGFLRPPSFAALRAAAARGPVVLLNASEYGCSALLLTTAGVRVVDLDRIPHERLAEQLVAFVHSLQVAMAQGRPVKAHAAVMTTLARLWDDVAEPVLRELGHTRPVGPGGTWPRLWWCPTGLFTLLPLHAAGRHRVHGGSDTVLDRVVSSYTPTLRALLHTRERPRPSAGPHTRGLIVSLPTTPGCSDLPAAEHEARALHQRHPDAELVTGAAATTQTVLKALAGCSWAHFACHGAQDLGRPSRGAVILHDGPLTLRDIVRLRLPHAEFAFLSACETARGGVVLADEAISFAASLQLAGFRDVIGTLWSIDDTLAPEIADLVYENLSRRSTRDPAAALHAALHTVRARRPHAVANWAPYVHAGP
ncbi:CHAT domain-containing protein [Streptomyces sp. TRM70350]|uniref:CHAT domain-containing protein n=1 Tax=Streptomyces sp. TRM70350 TaxID=2856165 RepID=UPI001C4479CB|nr:CHAT domain-containing protein [Streptomyces sp. TRM70350]MBV7698492.1 CHAT domain-containing protein [Streptomyces sp. TRM70350]